MNLAPQCPELEAFDLLRNLHAAQFRQRCNKSQLPR